jgi:hypothetical protein
VIVLLANGTDFSRYVPDLLIKLAPRDSSRALFDPTCETQEIKFIKIATSPPRSHFVTSASRWRVSALRYKYVSDP